MAGRLVTELGCWNRVRVIWGISCKLLHGAEQHNAIPKADLPQGLEQKGGHGLAPSLPSVPGLAAWLIATFGFSSTVISPPFFLWARNSHFLFTDGKKNEAQAQMARKRA